MKLYDFLLFQDVFPGRFSQSSRIFPLKTVSHVVQGDTVPREPTFGDCILAVPLGTWAGLQLPYSPG